MATLDATTIPASSLTPAVSPSDNWDIDGAEEIPAGENNQVEESTAGQADSGPAAAAQPAADDWNLDDGWEMNVPIESPQPAEVVTVEAIAPETDELELPTTEASDIENLAASEEASELPQSPEDATAVNATPSPAGEANDANEPVEVTSDDVLSEIADAERECERADAVLEALKARMKEAKEDKAAAINKLRRLVRELAGDATRPILANSAATSIAASSSVDDPEDDDELDDDDLDDEADTEPEDKSAAAGEQVERGKPTRIRVLNTDPDWPQVPAGSEHDITSIEEDGTIVIQDPALEEGEIMYKPDECEVIAWEELPVANASTTSSPSKSVPTQSLPQEPEDESWRKASLLDDVGLPPNLAELLAENPEKTIKTVGDMSDWTAMGKNLTDVPKIGPAKVTKIEEAMERFWARRNAKK